LPVPGSPVKMITCCRALMTVTPAG
jgi:hypothetical protein